MVRLQKENNGVAEISLSVQVTLMGEMGATAGQDFEVSTMILEFDPSNQTRDFPVRILPDSIPEGVENFTLRAETAPNAPSLNTANIPTTIISIIDQDG